MFAIGNATLDASAPICGRAEPTILTTDKWIVMLASWNFGTPEARANFESFGGRD